jgi:hypothetical protein
MRSLPGDAEHGLKFSHIVLDRGNTTSQPMLTIPGSGTLTEQFELIGEWTRLLSKASLHPRRVKVEAAPDNVGVPQADKDAVEGRYFEHHVKLLLPDDDIARRVELTRLLEPLHARLSRNARRQRPDGAQERFVTQRCHREGRINARAQLDVLLPRLRETGYPILEVEGSTSSTTATSAATRAGWSTRGCGIPAARTRCAPRPRASSTTRARISRSRRTGCGSAATSIRRSNSSRPPTRQANPIFADPAVGRAWRAARWTTILGVLGAITPFADRLVLRGSVALRAIFGDKAREPGDLDFVVTPSTLSIGSPDAEKLLHGVIAAVGADEVSIEDIWTYERAAGKRLLFPFQVAGLPRGTVQLDVVFHEPLPLPAELILLDGLDVPLLAEHTDADPDLVRELIRPELGPLADEFGPDTVLSWSMDWTNLADQYPDLPPDRVHWQERLALAMTRFWR